MDKLVIAAWLIALASMSLLMLLMFWKTGKFRQGLLVSLLWGKLLAGVYYLLGVDVPLYYIYYVKNGRILHEATVTAAEVIFLSFLISFLVAWQWPRLSRELGLPRSIG